MIELIVLILLFIALSGALAMTDAAILSVSHAEIEELVTQKKRGAKILQTINDRITHAVIVIVIVTNTINVLGPILVGQKAIELYGSTVIGVITAILTLGTIIFSEIIPKSIGTHHAPRIARYAAPIIRATIIILYPLVLLLDKLTSFFSSDGRIIGTEAQIRSLVTKGREEGHIETDEGQLIHRAFLLNDKKAADVMTPLKDIVGLQHTDTIREAADKISKQPYSRYPIFEGSINDIAGIAMSKEILEHLSDGKDDNSIMTIVRDPLIVPHSMPSDDLLELFKTKHIHLAVIQEDAHTVGIATLEDVLEELVGEIEDEEDIEAGE